MTERERSATRRDDKADAIDLFDTWYAFTAVDSAVFDRVGEIFGEDGIEDTAHDSYDCSLEIYSSKDIAPTREQVDAVLAMGFAKFWINFPDDSEICCGKNVIGQRIKRSYQKWRHGGRPSDLPTKSSTAATREWPYGKATAAAATPLPTYDHNTPLDGHSAGFLLYCHVYEARWAGLKTGEYCPLWRDVPPEIKGQWQALAGNIATEFARTKPIVAPSATASAKDEIGWLIERADLQGPFYFCGYKNGNIYLPYWHTDNQSAVRFSRKCDAEGVACSLKKPTRVCDHMWVNT